jgi:CSLREA domain-containing protein
MRRTTPALAFVLALAACTDGALPTDVPDGPAFANGPKGTLTVNNLADPGDGLCSPDHCTLREAIAAAQPGDRIGFKSGLSGTIQLTAGALVASDVTVDGAGRITVDAMQQSRVFRTNGQVTLAGLVITGGRAAGTSVDGFGGGVYNSGALLLDRVSVTGNTAHVGAGIFNHPDGAMGIVNSMVSENAATNTSWGGGISNSGTMQIVTSTLVHNSADQGNDRQGGAVFNHGSGTLSILGSTVGANSANLGGGIYNNGIVTITRSLVAANTAAIDGGGMTNRGTATVLQSTFSANTAAFYGGAIYHVQGQLHVRSSTVTGNSASIGGILVVAGTGYLTGSIVAGNTNGDCAGTTSLGYNLGAQSGGCTTAGLGDVVVTASQVFTEVLEATLKDNGGGTWTHALIERGRAIDAGYCPGQTTDQRGFARPFDDTRMPNALDGCDIGAFEWQPAEPAAGGPGKGPKK